MGRSLTQLALILDELNRLKVPLIASSQGIDTLDDIPAGRLQLGGLTAARELKAHCRLDDSTLALLQSAMAEYNLSARAYDRILKVSRTIAEVECPVAVLARVGIKRFRSAAPLVCACLAAWLVSGASSVKAPCQPLPQNHKPNTESRVDSSG